MASCPDIGGFPARRICCQFSMSLSCLWEVDPHFVDGKAEAQRGENSMLICLPTTAPGPVFLTSFPEQLCGLWGAGDCLQNFRECLAWNTPTVVSCSFPSFCQTVVSGTSSCALVLCFLSFASSFSLFLLLFQYLILNSSCYDPAPC